MALARTLTTALDGVHARIVTVEANIGPGLPGIHIVGMGDTSVRESRYRLRTAVANTQLQWPKTKIVVSLSPADVPKRGSHADLAMCLAVLAARHPLAEQRIANVLILGELGLDGSVRPVPGVLPAILAARTAGIRTVVVPAANSAEAALAEGISTITVDTLDHAWNWAIGERELPAAEPASAGSAPKQPCFSELAGQHAARFAAEVAAAGGHHLMLTGPPGSGKSMLVERLPAIMPPLSRAAALEVAAIRSITGTADSAFPHAGIPLVAPHHTVTRTGLIGGLRPGAITHAHHGLLFLDEASEIPAAVLDGLRTPLERGEITLNRGTRSTTFPARFQLILAANPCRCGAESPTHCRCSVAARQKYLSNISGPLRDRLDMSVSTTGINAVISSADAESSAAIASRVVVARGRALHRFRRPNAAVPGPELRRHAPADEAGMALIEAHLAAGELTQRGVDRALRLAWTICDLEAAARPNIDHVARALELREGADS